MIDVHCHLMPQIDDGSQSEQKSVEQMRIMAMGGITHAFLTAHYMQGVYDYDRSEYDAKLARMRELARENNIAISLEQGFEIYLHPKSAEEVEHSNLTLGKSKYVLLESDLNGLPPDFYYNVFPLLRKGYKPILAHAERYVSIMKKITRARDLIDRIFYLQVNSGSLLGLYGEKVRQTAWVLVRNGWAHLLGSDDHGRAPYGSYFQATELLQEDLDGQTVELLTQDFPQMILENKAIPHKYVYIQHSHSHSHSHNHRSKSSLWDRLFS